DIIATTTGRIIPQGKTKIIQPLDTGIVSAIHVSDGDHVKAGDVLIELNTAQTLADRDRYQRDLLQAELSLASLRGLAAMITKGGDLQTLRLVGAPTPADDGVGRAE